VVFHVKQLNRLWQDESGQDLIEYSLLMAFVALSVVVLLGQVGHGLFNLWVVISSKISSAVVLAGS
jgi:Flp pilus assembly pilin Flp